MNSSLTSIAEEFQLPAPSWDGSLRNYRKHNFKFPKINSVWQGLSKRKYNFHSVLQSTFLQFSRETMLFSCVYPIRTLSIGYKVIASGFMGVTVLSVSYGPQISWCILSDPRLLKRDISPRSYLCNIFRANIIPQHVKLLCIWQNLLMYSHFLIIVMMRYMAWQLQGRI